MRIKQTLLPVGDLETAKVPETTLRSIRKGPAAWARKAKIKELEQVIMDAKEAYYNSSRPIMTDRVFDAIYEVLEDRNPRSSALKTGVSVKEKVTLPVYMGSLTKVKSADALSRWEFKQGVDDFIVMDKLDGVAFLLEKDGDRLNMYTRGDGKVGQNISMFIKHIDSIPAGSRIKNGSLIRGELIMSQSKFDGLWAKTAANARNMVSGLVNAKGVSRALSDVDAVAYEIVGRSKPDAQIKALKQMGFDTVSTKRMKYLDFDDLVDLLEDRKSKTKYEIDGLVIRTNSAESPNTSGNPSYSVAFKHNTEADMKVARVVEVHWQESKYGKLKPRVEIEPMRLSGVEVRYFTGHNAEFIQDNKIGPGATIRVVRSGGVIPYIVDVVKKAKKAQMPDKEYTWDGVDVRTVGDGRSSTVELKRAVHFFNVMEVDGMKEGNVSRLMEIDGVNDVVDIINLDPDALQEILGRTIGSRLDRRLEDLYSDKHPMTLLLNASGEFESIGTSRFRDIVNAVPNFMEIKSKRELEGQLNLIPGVGPSVSKAFTKNMPAFRKWLSEVDLEYYIDSDLTAPKGSLTGEVVLFSGFRDKALERTVRENGGQVAPGWSRKVTILLVSDYGFSSSKVTKAEDAGIPVLTADDFIGQYGI